MERRKHAFRDDLPASALIALSGIARSGVLIGIQRVADSRMAPAER